jgi:hypothetical protein
MSPGMVALMTILVIVAGFLVIRFVVGTISFLFNSLLVIAVLLAAGYLYFRYKSSE